MENLKNLTDCMAERGMSQQALLAATGLERKILDAILHGRYTPSPDQRRRVAAALGMQPEQIAWGHTTEVQHLYGHGPQFGRTP
jgi:transcriptional regulator with XRE-family HTH domain